MRKCNCKKFLIGFVDNGAFALLCFIVIGTALAVGFVYCIDHWPEITAITFISLIIGIPLLIAIIKGIEECNDGR